MQRIDHSAIAIALCAVPAAATAAAAA